MTSSQQPFLNAVTQVVVVGEFGTTHCNAVRSGLWEQPYLDSVQILAELHPSNIEQLPSDLRLAVFTEDRRDQFSVSIVELLRQQFPLVRIVFVQSDWCTGKFLPSELIPGVTYVRINRWPQFVRDALRSNGSQAAMFDLPLTASQTETQIADSDRTLPRFKGMRIAIDCDLPGDCDAMAAMVQELGGVPVLISSDVNSSGGNSSNVIADLIVSCCADPQSFDSDRIGKNRSFLNVCSKDAPIWLFTNFPRESDRARLLALGIERVIALPFQFAEL